MRAGLVVVVMSGCFAELGGGYYPFVSQTTTTSMGATDTVHAGAWMAMIKLGFFADVVFDDSLGFAVGWSPFGTNVAKPGDPVRGHGGGGHMFRGDLVLPPVLFDTESVHARIVAEYEILTSIGIQEPNMQDLVDHDGSGRRYFLGAGLSRTKDYGSQMVQIGFDHLSLRTDYPAPMNTPDVHESVESSAWGMSASITITVLPASHPNGIVVYGGNTPSTSPGACGPVTCDAHGVCTKTCP